MHEGVPAAVKDYKPTGNFVEINVLIQRQNCSQTSRSHPRQRLTKHQYQNPSAVKVQTLSYEKFLLHFN
jgi:hypothetical protein